MIHKKQPINFFDSGGGGDAAWSSIQQMKKLKKYTRDNLDKT
jgi:hypothetical protein